MDFYDYTGTLADWIMAGSAFYAAWNARSWFKQSQINLGFEQANNFILNLEKAVLTAVNESYSIHDDIYTFRKNIINPDHDVQSKMGKKYQDTTESVIALKVSHDNLVRMGIQEKKSIRLRLIVDNLLECAFNNQHAFYSCIYSELKNHELENARPLANKVDKLFKETFKDKKAIWDFFEVSK